MINPLNIFLYLILFQIVYSYDTQHQHTHDTYYNPNLAAGGYSNTPYTRSSYYSAKYLFFFDFVFEKSLIFLFQKSTTNTTPYSTYAHQHFHANPNTYTADTAAQQETYYYQAQAAAARPYQQQQNFYYNQLTGKYYYQKSNYQATSNPQYYYDQTTANLYSNFYVYGNYAEAHADGGQEDYYNDDNDDDETSSSKSDETGLGVIITEVPDDDENMSKSDRAKNKDYVDAISLKDE